MVTIHDPRAPPTKAMMERGQQLFKVLRELTINQWNEKDKNGTGNGWTNFHSYFKPACLLEGIVFGNGQQGNRVRPLPDTVDLDNYWWPCIMSDLVCGEVGWVRCEPLIYQGSRPWRTHVTRLMVFDAAGNAVPILHYGRPPSIPPPPPSTQPTWMTTSTVEIEELEETAPIVQAAPILALPACCTGVNCFEVAIATRVGFFCGKECFKKRPLRLKLCLEEC